MENREICKVTLQYGSYSGEETVYCDPNDDHEYIIAKAWRQALRDGEFLAMATKTAKIVSREPYDGSNDY